MQAKAIVALVAAALLFGAGWMVRGWRADAAISTITADYDRRAVDASEKARQAEERMRGKVAELDQLQKDIEHAKAENASLRADLASGNKRVLVRASCPASGGVPETSGAARVDDAAGYAELDGKVAERLFGIAGDGDSEIRKLNALQQYVREVCLAPN